MFIEIEPNSPVAIYTQLIHQIKKAIVKGDLQRGEMLPSVRVLAGDLGVNMHTINKAYNLLVEEGVLLKSQRGYTVEEKPELPADFEAEIQARLEELLVDVFVHDVPAEKVEEWTQAIAKELKREW